MKTIEITNEDFEYMQSIAVPLEDTTASIFSRIVATYKELSDAGKAVHAATPSKPSLALKFEAKNLPSVSFTTIIEARIDEKAPSGLYWNDILEDIIKISAKKSDIEKALKHISANWRVGEHQENGYRYLEEFGVSFQAVSAERASKFISALSKAYQIPVEIELVWQNKPKAQFPGQTGSLKLP